MNNATIVFLVIALIFTILSGIKSERRIAELEKEIAALKGKP